MHRAQAMAEYATVGVMVALTGSEAAPPAVVLRQGLIVAAAPSISGDGRFVAFVSAAGLAPRDLNTYHDVYVFDREEATLTLETAAVTGGASNGSSGKPALSADGRFLVFASDATNLTSAPDTNLAMDVFVRDRLEGWTRRISVGSGPQEANGDSSSPAISADGRLVAFVSDATNLAAGVDANGARPDVYLAALDTGAVSRISVGSNGRQPSAGRSLHPALSGDGRVVAFVSTARFDDEIGPSAGDAPFAVFARDLSSGVTTRISADDGGRAFSPSVSVDGRFVVFTRASKNIEPSSRSDVVLVDRIPFAHVVLTHRGNGSSSMPKISADGRFVVFQSEASNLECSRRCAPYRADENLLSDIYLLDRTTQIFTRVSGNPGPWWAPSTEPAISATGRVVAFSSREPIGSEDMTTDYDLFVMHSGATINSRGRD